MSYTNRRIFYASQAAGLAPFSSTVFTAIHGLQTLGVNTNFTLDDINEIGQVSVYQLVEQVPEIEVNLEKVLDGSPLIYHLGTQLSAGPSLVARANQRAGLAVSIYGDVQQSASGVPLEQMFCSGIYLSSEAFAFTTDAPFKETTSFVGNDIQWLSGGFTFQPAASVFNSGQDSPLALAGSGGVQIRRDIIFYPILGPGDPLLSLETASTLDANGQVSAFLTILPPVIAGISSSGTNDRDANGNFSCHITAMNASCNLNRDAILELGRKEPYFRFAQFPAEVTSDVTIIALLGDLVNASEKGTDGLGNNLTNQSFRIRVREGTFINLGIKNKLKSTSYGGGDATGGQVNCTYSFTTYSDFTITHPMDSFSPGVAYPY